MKNKKIPVYVLCGSNETIRLTFYTQFCQDAQPLRIFFASDAQPTDQGVHPCRLDADASPNLLAQQLLYMIRQTNPDSLWLQWPDTEPVSALLQLMQTDSLRSVCTLLKIIRCGEADDELSLLSQLPDTVRDQLAQCDLYALSKSNRKLLRLIRRQVTAIQPDIEVVAYEQIREIGAVMTSRNLLQPLRFGLVLAFCALGIGLLPRFSFSIANAIAIFLGTFLQALPFLMLGILLSSIIQVFVPADFLQRVFPKKLLGGMLFGVLGGFLMPVCDCASVPVFRSLIKKGVPLPAAVTFMLAAPIINPVVMLSTYYAFGGNLRVMFTRMGFGIVCSLLIGLIFAFGKQSVLTDRPCPTGGCACGHVHSHSGADDHPHGMADGRIPPYAQKATRFFTRMHQRLLELVAHFIGEFFEVAKFLLIGIAVSTVLQLIMGSKLTTMRVTNLAQGMLLMMAMAFLLSLCSSSDAVVGKNMGVSLPLGAVMSFLVFGPMMDIKNLILLSSGFTSRFIVKLLAATAIVCFIMVYIAFSLGLEALLL